MKNKILIFITVLVCLICTTVNAESKTEYFKEWSTYSLYTDSLSEDTLDEMLIFQTSTKFNNGYVVSGVDMKKINSETTPSYIAHINKNAEEVKRIYLNENVYIIELISSEENIFAITVSMENEEIKIEKFDSKLTKLAEKNIEDIIDIGLLIEAKAFNTKAINFVNDQIYITLSTEEALVLDTNLNIIETKSFIDNEEELCSVFENLCIIFTTLNSEDSSEFILGYDKNGTKEVLAGSYIDSDTNEQIGFLRLVDNGKIVFEKNFIYEANNEYYNEMITAQFLGNYIITYGLIGDSYLGVKNVYILDLEGNIIQTIDEKLYITGLIANENTFLTSTISIDLNCPVGDELIPGICSKYSMYSIASVVTENTEETYEYYGESNDDAYEDILKTNDGGYIIVGYTNEDALISKYNKKHDVEWQKTLGWNGVDSFKAIIEVSDGFIAIGTTTSTDIAGLTNKGSEDGLVVKFDKNGNVLWQKIYGGNGADCFYGITESTEGEFAIVGQTTSTDIANLNKTETDNSGLILIYDKNGNLKNQKIYDKNTSESFKKIVYKNNEYVVIGQTFGMEYSETQSSNVDFSAGLIIKYDKNLNVVWEQSHVIKNSDYNHVHFYDIIVDENNNYIVSGTYCYWSGEASYIAYIFKYDTDGNLLTEKGFIDLEMLSFSSGFYSIAQSNDGGFIVTGTTYAYPGNYTIMVKYDSDGKEQWIQRIVADIYIPIYMNSIEYLFADIIELGTNEFVLVGSENDDAAIYRYKHANKTYMKPSTNGSYNVDLNNGKNQVIVTPDEGYELDDIVIKTTTGEKIKYYEENGKYYFDANTDTIVKVTFKEKIENPNTITFLKLGFLALIVFAIYNLFISKKLKINRYA